MADHKQGEMDITEQERTFQGFVTAVTRTSIFIVVLLIFLAIVNA